ncbi:transposase, partial [Candidatus Hakubella thermalkaliphila]
MSAAIPKGILGYARYKLKQISYSKESIEVNVELERDSRHNHLCSVCNQKASPERRKERTVKDLLFHGWKTFTKVEYYEVRCKQCGIRVEHIPFIRPCARATKRLEQAVAWLCQHLPLTVVALYFSLNWKTVKNIDKAYLEHRFEAPGLDNITVIGIDEVSYRKGHKYLTCVFDLNDPHLIWVGPGKNKETLSKFFEQLGKERGKRIKAVAIDMSKAYIEGVKEHCPNALIVHDKFHILQDFNKVMDRIRIDEFKKADEEYKGFFKRTKWLLVMNPLRLKEDGKMRLSQLLNINMPLNTAYTWGEQLKQLWECVTVAQFNKALD